MMDKRELRNKQQRERRRRDNNAATCKYEKTINGFLVRLYRNMQSRVTGVQKKKAHLYSGKELIDRNEFYSWAKSCNEFFDMFERWENSMYSRKLTPTVDRIISSEGYTIDNMQWITHSENSKKGAYSRHNKPYPN